MSTLKKFNFPALEQWNIEALQFGIQEPQKEDSNFEVKNDFYNFMVDFYNLLSESPTKLFIPVGVSASQKIREKCQSGISYVARPFVPEADHRIIESGLSGVAAYQQEIVYEYLRFFYDIGKELTILDSNMVIDRSYYTRIIIKHQNRIKLIRRSLITGKEKPHFDLNEVLENHLNWYVKPSSNLELMILCNRKYNRMQEGLKLLADINKNNKPFGFCKFCRLDYSDAPKISVSYDDILEMMPEYLLPFFRKLRDESKESGNTIKIEFKAPIGSIYSSKIIYKIGNKPVYVCARNAGGKCLYNVSSYLRWPLTPEQSRAFFEDIDKQDKPFADIICHNLRRCRLSACNFDNGTWCKVGYRSEVVRGDEHFFICGVETWNHIGFRPGDFEMIFKYLRYISKYSK